MPREVEAEDAGESCIFPWELTRRGQGTEGKVQPLQLILGGRLAQSHAVWSTDGNRGHKS